MTGDRNDFAQLLDDAQEQYAGALDVLAPIDGRTEQCTYVTVCPGGRCTNPEHWPAVVRRDVHRLELIGERLDRADVDDESMQWRVMPREHGPCTGCGHSDDHLDRDHWYFGPPSNHPPLVVAGDYVDEGEPDVYIEVISEHEQATAEFIAHAPADITYLLAIAKAAAALEVQDLTAIGQGVAVVGWYELQAALAGGAS